MYGDAGCPPAPNRPSHRSPTAPLAAEDDVAEVALADQVTEDADRLPLLDAELDRDLLGYIEDCELAHPIGVIDELILELLDRSLRGDGKSRESERGGWARSDGNQPEPGTLRLGDHHAELQGADDVIKRRDGNQHTAAVRRAQCTVNGCGFGGATRRRGW